MKDRNRFVILMTALGLLPFVIILAWLLLRDRTPSAEERAGAAAAARAETFIAAIHEQRYDDAWAMTARDYRGEVAASEFAEWVGSNELLGSASEFTVGDYSEAAGGPWLEGRIYTDDRAPECRVRFVREDGRFFIRDLLVDGESLLVPIDGS